MISLPFALLSLRDPTSRAEAISAPLMREDSGEGATPGVTPEGNGRASQMVDDDIAPHALSN
jgi:hypothetical protein